MKKCPKCAAEYDDSRSFCAACGTQLEAVQPASSEPAASGSTTPSTPGPTPPSTPARPTTPSTPGFFENWGGVLVAALGLFIEYEWSIMLGTALAVVGFITSLRSTNAINKAGAGVLCVIAVILCFIYI